MNMINFPRAARLACVAALMSVAANAQAEPQYAIAMYGDPALPQDFVSLPYANADAPKGGQVTFGLGGAFDSLNPHIRKGRSPSGIRFYVSETLMGRSWDEPFTLYGLLAESVETGPNREWVEFTLRPEARFSDGSPVTVEDVLWSYETLGTIGHPRYHRTWSKVASAEAVGERTVRFTFVDASNRELALIMGLRPILKKSQWDGRDFAESGLDPVPIGSGPYVIGDFEAGRYVELDRDPNWWGADLAFNQGLHNFDTIRYDYFGDGDVIFEAFKAGEISTFREGNAAKWAEQYDFPRVRNGEVTLSLVGHRRPTGITGFVMNTRRAPFDDWRVREAMMQAFNYEFISQTLNGGTDPRITSYFSNSVLGMQAGPAEGRVRALLEPFADSLLPGALDGYALPVSDGSERNRAGIVRATELLEQAGWTIQDGALRNGDGQPFNFEILLNQGSTLTHQIIDLYTSALSRLGITPTITLVDSAQYRERTNQFDFAMAYYRRGLSLSPGNEQNLYWSADAADVEGSRNWMGMRSPAAEAMIAAMLTAESRDGSIAATRALDRVLTTGRYVIPIWTTTQSRLAHDSHLNFQRPVAAYGDWLGFLPDVWWYEE